MSGSRCLILAAALAVALGAQGCNRDYKAPKPKTSVTVMSAAVTSYRGDDPRSDDTSLRKV